MARTPLLVISALFLSLKCLLGEFVSAKLGESVKLSASKNCTDDKRFTLIHRLKDDSPLTVARRDYGIWTPEENDADRVAHLSVFCVVLSRLNINDNGMYEFACGNQVVTFIQLEVLRPTPVSVSEGDTAELPCYYRTAGEPVKSVRWERNGTLVIELDRASREISYGTGFGGKASVSADWFSEGNLSLTLSRAQLQDQGDYFCYIQDEDAKRRKGDPAAVTLTVSCAPEDVCPKDKEKEGMETWSIVIITLTVTLVIVGLSAFALGRKHKSCRSNASFGPGGTRPANVEIPLTCNGDPVVLACG